MAKKATRQDDKMFLNSILENIPDMVFVKDAKDLRFVRFNKAGEKLLGLSRKDLIGKNDYDFFPKKEADFFTRKDRAVLKNKKLLDIPAEPIHTKNSGVRILHTKKIPLLNSKGRSQYLLGISEDITERKNTETALQKTYDELKSSMRELEAFSYSVSHDLRAPLRVIQGFSKILLDEHGEALNPEGKRLLEGVSKNALHMSQLIDDLLSFSRAGRKDFVKRRVPMEDLTRLIIEELQKEVFGARCHFDVHSLPDVEGDAPLLRQVWTNLLSNAVKFSRNNPSPVVEINAKETPDGLVYSVRDNGVGFDMQYAGKLFGVFQRLHTTMDFEGTGVGLAIVQRIVLKHGGRVWAEGDLNKGAVFYFLLPRNSDTH